MMNRKSAKVFVINKNIVDEGSGTKVPLNEYQKASCHTIVQLKSLSFCMRREKLMLFKTKFV